MRQARNDRLDLGESALPASLALIAGMVDVTGWITLGGLFTAHVTGNLVVMAAGAFDGRTMHGAQMMAVPLFFVVALTVGASVRVLRPKPWHVEPALLGLQAFLLVAAAVLASAVKPSMEPERSLATVVALLAVTAMAVQNVMLHLCSSPAPTTGVMTGNIVTSALSLVGLVTRSPAGRIAPLAQWRRTWPVVAGFMAGCLLGSASTHLWSDKAWFVPAIASLALLQRQRLRARERNGLTRATPAPEYHDDNAR
jgi:uncharacterized membrane protein YoaK (UPF0700 family)